MSEEKEKEVSSDAANERPEAVELLALELAQLTLSPDGIPDAEDWEIAELLFRSKAE